MRLPFAYIFAICLYARCVCARTCLAWVRFVNEHADITEISLFRSWGGDSSRKQSNYVCTRVESELSDWMQQQQRKKCNLLE